MRGHLVVGAVLQAKTCIEPDRIARLTREVERNVRTVWYRPTVRFDEAGPGMLRFSVRHWRSRFPVMSFAVVIERDERDGFTLVDVCTGGVRASMRAARAFDCYLRQLSSAITRFDPKSTVILVSRLSP